MSSRIEYFANVSTGKPSGEYDLVLCNHNTCAAMLGDVEGFKIFTQHGPSHSLEQAPPWFDAFAAVSEETQAVMARSGIAAEVVRNPIDMKVFAAKGITHPKVLIMCKNRDAGLIVQEICELRGFPCMVVDAASEPINPAEHIPSYDIVITSGRGVYEALACNKAVLIFDKRSGLFNCDGWVTDKNIFELRQYNCSGRSPLFPQMHKDTFGDMLDAFPARSYWGREYIREHHEAATIIDQYLKIERKENGKETDQHRSTTAA